MDFIYLFFAQFILGYALQSSMNILGLYSANKKKIEFKKFLISSLIFMVVIYIARSLPVSFGVHTLISVLVLILIGVKYLKLSIYPTISASLIMVILILLSETINIWGLQQIYTVEVFQSIMNNPLKRAIAVIPSSIIFTTIIIICYILLSKSNKKKVN